MRTSAALLVVALGFFATEAHTSGSYGGGFYSPSFKYTHAESSRHSFIDDESADGYYAGYDREVKVDFLAMQPKAERAIAAARTAGVPIGPFDLFLPSVQPKSADVTKIDKAAYPLNLVLDVSSNDSATERFVVTATAPFTTAQLTSLTATLKALAAIKGKHNEMSDAKDAADKATVDAAGFTEPLAATHVDALFGLYVGTTTAVMARDKPRVLGLLQARLDKMLPALRAHFAAADAQTQLHLPGPLAPVKPHVDKHPQGLPGAFHPYGPLASGSLIRMNVELGEAAAIVMISPPEKHDWSKVHPVLREWLEAADR